MLADHVAARKAILAMQDRCQVATFDHMRLGWASQGTHEGCRQVDHFHQSIANLSTADIGLRPRVGNDQRHLHGGLVIEILIAHPVIAHVVAMIRGKGNDRVLAEPFCLHPRKQPPQMVVKLLDQAHIGRDNVLPHMVSRKTLANAGSMICAHQRMVRLALGFGPDGWDDVPFVVHLVIGRRHDVWPVRLDVGQVAHPRTAILARLTHEIHCAIGHISRLGVFFWNVRRKSRVLQKPGREQLAIRIQPGIREILPRVIRRIAMGHQIVVIGRPALPMAVRV